MVSMIPDNLYNVRISNPEQNKTGEVLLNSFLVGLLRIEINECCSNNRIQK